MGRKAFTLSVTDQGAVVVIVGADRINLGSRDAAPEEVSRFLVEVGYCEGGICAGAGTRSPARTTLVTSTAFKPMTGSEPRRSRTVSVRFPEIAHYKQTVWCRPFPATVEQPSVSFTPRGISSDDASKA